MPTPRIQILDSTTANQIAAGEVVERPASAVKELVENALDAGARQVVVELDDGGKTLIRVTDDGCGMGQEDAILSLERHATSKIRDAADLFKIVTMGFRGEAIPSIASVSRTTIITKLNTDDDSPGIEVRCAGGAVESVREIGARAGTSITVEDLFYNVPARLKFLKSPATELSHIVELIQRFALARPDIGFRLLQRGQDIFSAPGGGSAIDSCVYVFGRDTARHLAPLAHETETVRVHGFIGTPEALKSSRSGQHTFVNKRFVRNRAVSRALDDAYKSLQTIHGMKFPVAVLMIEVDPADVDVNVSPTKTEVRFHREGEVFSAVWHAVREGLMRGGLVPVIDREPAAKHAAADEPRTHAMFTVPSRPAGVVRPDPIDGPAPFRQALLERAGLTPTLPDPFDTPPAASRVAELPRAAYAPTAGNNEPPDTRLEPAMGADYRHHDLRSLRVLAQTRNMYILAQTSNALLLIDQHIAHERVLYEKLLRGATTPGAGIPVQHLMIPLTLQFSRREALVVEGRLAELARAGFELESFGADSFLLRAAPASVASKKLKAQDGPEATLRAIVEEMVEKTTSRKLLLPAEEVLITASCKMAVKAGDPLTFEEMEALIDDLLKSDNPYTCPHGRPILIELANNEMDRRFGR